MAKEKLFDVPDDRRNFKEQMTDLGVSVEAKKPKTMWHKVVIRRGGLKNKLSYTKTSMLIGDEAAEKIGLESRLEFGIMERGEKMLIIMRKNKHGLKMHTTKSKSMKITSRTLFAWFEEQGVRRGIYRVEEIKGGWIAVPEVLE